MSYKPPRFHVCGSEETLALNTIGQVENLYILYICIFFVCMLFCVTRAVFLHKYLLNIQILTLQEDSLALQCFISVTTRSLRNTLYLDYLASFHIEKM